MQKRTDQTVIIPGKKQTDELPDYLSAEEITRVTLFHRTIGVYDRTPLTEWAELARTAGVKGIYIKDEATRFGLNSFKSLGSVYAMARIISRELGLGMDLPEGLDYDRLTTPEVRQRTAGMVFVTATDGNHGKGVAWSAEQFGCRAVVYMPQGTQACRVEAIKAINHTEVAVTEWNYDDTVRFAARQAAEHGWFLVQDTAWEGYEEIPRLITQGYATMAVEALEQLVERGSGQPTHVFLQAGVGSMAAGVLGYLAHVQRGNPPIATVVEPTAAACVFASVQAGDGAPHAISGNPQTIMAGLNCGEPSALAWPVLRDQAAFFASCPDYVAAEGMRALARPKGADPQVIAGESGAAGFGLLYLLLQKPELAEYRQDLGLDEASVILVFNTEGETDRESYHEIVAEGKYPFPHLQPHPQPYLHPRPEAQ